MNTDILFNFDAQMFPNLVKKKKKGGATSD
jgi:hypothetical protein